MKSILEKHDLILMEAAIIEQIRRADGITFHPDLVHAQLIYDDHSRKQLEKLYQNYITVAAKAKLPFIMCTPTWRTNYERVTRSKADPNINSDGVRFLKDIRDAQGTDTTDIKIGGLIGCKNDAYKPNEALSVSESEKFHSWQVDQLDRAGVDFLIAETLPNVEEAAGLAKAMEKTDKQYMISFVVDRNGCLLDGTSLSDAIIQIDLTTNRQPLCYMINCSYPSFLRADKQPAELFNRLLGCQANASSMDHCDLDESEHIKTESVAEWGQEMLTLNRKYGMKILGGCCGTSTQHLEYLAKAHLEI